MKRLAFLLSATVLAGSVFAQMKDMDMKGMDMKSENKGGKAAVHKGTGTVTKVDPAKNAVTIAHGPVQSMKWPAMTMTFKAKDKAMLDKVKPGEKIEFSFVQSGKDYIVTEIK
jgi:Cu(I)/Ag(I) efflux system periplasmic protein CusF